MGVYYFVKLNKLKESVKKKTDSCGTNLTQFYSFILILAN
jgi:hypothetical protein